MWDERYATDEYVYGREPNDFLVEMADRLPRGRALCLGEGEGRNAVFLAQRGFTVTAVDSSGVALTKARRLAAELGVDIETVQADLGDFSLDPGQWDLILSIFCHLPPPLRATVHRRSAAGLRPGGAFLLEAYRVDQLALGTGGPPTAELMMDLATLRRELPALRFIHARETVRDIREGRFHSGAGAVVQVLAVPTDADSEEAVEPPRHKDLDDPGALAVPVAEIASIDPRGGAVQGADRQPPLSNDICYSLSHHTIRRNRP